MNSFQKKLQHFVDSPITQNVIIWLIIINALIMGFETFPWYKNLLGTGTEIVDKFFVWIFLLEVVLKILAYRLSFFKSGWNNFDFFIVIISLIPGNSAFSALRAIRTLRIFRTTRLFGRIKNLRLIVGAMLHSLPKLGWLFLILAIFYYIFAVLSTSLFSEIAPKQFGSLWASFYSLFSIMTMEGWQDTIDAVNSPCARWIFIPFMLLTSYIFLNLVVGIIVAAMEEIVKQEKLEKLEQEGQIEQEESSESLQVILKRLDALQAQLDRIEKKNNNENKE
jgi:voltage-gated sodium channel